MGLPWVRPSPNLPTLASGLVYSSLVAFEGSNLSVGRGTDDAFQRFGASWLDASRVASLLNDMKLGGVRFVVDSFTPRNPGDEKYNGVRIPGVRIDLTDRNAMNTGLVAAAILSVVSRANNDSLRIAARTFDERFGSTRAREAIVGGADPRTVMGTTEGAVEAFSRAAARFLIYR